MTKGWHPVRTGDDDLPGGSVEVPQITVAESRLWFRDQLDGRSEQEQELPSYMWMALDRLRNGMHPDHGGAISAAERIRYFRRWLPVKEE